MLELGAGVVLFLIRERWPWARGGVVVVDNFDI